VQTKGEDLKQLDKIVSSLIKKGQPLTHIYAEHGDELGISQRTLYNYIDAGVLSVKNIDLRRKTSYRPRKKKYNPSPGFSNQKFRKGRSYDDFQAYMVQNPDIPVVEMDTVKGVREQGKRMLTMIFCQINLMLIFLLKDGKAESVTNVFDFLTSLIGIETFRRLFPVILTDNGTEFKHVDQLENTDTGEKRTRIFYCDPQASWQKPHIEKNHEYIRYVIPRGRSFNKYTQEDINILMNHINSTRRVKLNYLSPYELANSDDMKYLMELLDMHFIQPDQVHLKPNLIG
jgi:IS30 family transposase